MDTITLRGSDLYDEVVNVLEASLDLAEDKQFWDQGIWRGPFRKSGVPGYGRYAEEFDWAAASQGRCGTRMCMAGTTCDVTGGRWLITLSPEGPRLPSGVLIPAEAALAHMDKLLAEPDDAPADVCTSFGYQVIDAADRAGRLLQLDYSDTPFYVGNSGDDPQELLAKLRRLRDRFYPRPG